MGVGRRQIDSLHAVVNDDSREDWLATMSLEADFPEREVDLISGKLTRKGVRLRKAEAP